MTPDEYIESILKKYAVLAGPYSSSETTSNEIKPIINRWSGNWLSEILISGSYAKSTAIAGSTDIDLFISLLPSTPGTLMELYESLYHLAESNGWFHVGKMFLLGLPTME